VIGDSTRELRNSIRNTHHGITEKEVIEYSNFLIEHQSEFDFVNDSIIKTTPVPFSCVPFGPSPTVPVSVHQLRASDIKVVAALGDSITAAFGAKAKNIFGIYTEYRGVSWSIGGDESIDSVLSLPNIMRQYNPALVGWSIGNGNQDSANARLDVAVTGAVASGLVDQANSLIGRLPKFCNMQNDWKVVTVWIGGNDLCAYCKDNNVYSPDQFEHHVRNTLRTLKAGIPRVFVNLVLAIDVTKLHELKGGLCGVLHGYECKCGTSNDANIRKKISEIAGEYNNRLVRLRDEKEFNDKDDFTVVIQPFFINTDIPRKSDGKPDKTYFAPDCFHFSFLCHEAAGVALWNNMVEPVGQKDLAWTVGEPIKCPSYSEYLYTNQNSV